MAITHRLIAGAIALAMLTGCGESQERLRETISPFADRLQGNNEPSRFEATRQQLADAGISQPLLRVVARAPVEQSAGYLAAGTANGVLFYTANDGSSVLLADTGVLRGTVGFLADLEAAETRQTARALAAGEGRYTRVLRHRRGEGSLFETRVACTLTRIGQERIVILGRAHDTTRHVEACASDGLDPAGRQVSFSNMYWIEDGRVRASEQWVDFETGVLRIEQVLP
ncbi:MAG: YjbF family lipoprotein [Pseudomonadota bacterium]